MTSVPRYDYLLKLMLLGDSGVGKTNLLERFVKDEFCPAGPTISMNFETKTLNIDGKTVKLHIWDSSGQTSFRPAATKYIPNTHGFILVYDITDPRTFQNLPCWMDQIKYGGTPNAPIILIAANIDCEIDRKVTTAQGQEFADKYGLHFYEASAKDDIDVVEAFTDITHTTFHFAVDIEAPKVNNDAHLDADCEEKKLEPWGCVIQ